MKMDEEEELSEEKPSKYLHLVGESLVHDNQCVLGLI